MPQSRYIVRGQKINPAKLKRAKELRRNMTPAEKKLWEALRRNQLDGLHFRRQQIIDGFIVDFYCHAAALIVEVDGPVHDQVEYDAERDRILAARGLHFVRVRNEEVMKNLAGVLERIRAACQDPSAPSPTLSSQGREAAAGEQRSGAGPPPLVGEGPGERSP